MDAKEKAKEILDKYRTYVVMWTGGIEVENANVKQCALIAVDEIIKEYESLDDNTNYDWTGYLTYWDNVKEEINKQ